MIKASPQYYFSHVLPNFLIIIFFLAGCGQAVPETRNRKVFIQKDSVGYTLYKDGNPYVIKGAAGFSHLSRLKEAGGNTIRIWDTLNLAAVLDEAHANDIAVIVGLPMPESQYNANFYEHPLKVARQYENIKKIVAQYKNHPALLMWCLGNELGFYETFQHDAFYEAFNNLIDMIHEQDPDHPVTTALIVFQKKRILNLRLKAPALDLISFNTFGRLGDFKRHVEDFSWFWNGPYLITEWGINGPWEAENTVWGAPIEDTSTKKAEQYQQRYEQYMPTNDPRFLGSFVFYWGQKQERTHTWFSLFSRDGKASEAVSNLQYLWKGTNPENQAPKIEYMLLDEKGARDNIIFEAKSAKTAEVLVHDPEDDSLALHWEILPEDWYYEHQDTVPIPAPLERLIIATEGKKLQFITPAREGPYRIFVEVHDHHGNYATANTPIYVIE